MVIFEVIKIRKPGVMNVMNMTQWTDAQKNVIRHKKNCFFIFMTEANQELN
jgi:hypothetical protein